MVIARLNSELGTERFGQMFGVTAQDLEEQHRLVSDRLASESNALLLSIRSTWDPDWTGTDADIIEDLIAPVEEIGIWFVSGRAWFNEDDEEILDDLS